MRIKLALATGAALALIAGTGAAAYAVVGQGWMNPTTTGNVLPIDDNHSPISRATTTDDHGGFPGPGDDRGGAGPAAASSTAPGNDDHGREPEPGDDRGGAASTATTASSSAATADDNHGRGQGSDDGAGHR